MMRFRPRSGAHILYNLALGTALFASFPVWIPWMAMSHRRRSNFLDRLGLRLKNIPAASGKERVWIHAVSVGETLSAVPLVRMLRKRKPDAEILFSTVTITGQEAAGKALGVETDARFYFPFDLPGIAGKFLDRVRPDAVVILETEIWPNFLAECFDRGIPAMIVNGRISGRSFRGYARFRFFFSRVLACITAITAQTEEDARRFLALGARPLTVTVTGNMKFDIESPAAGQTLLMALMGGEKTSGTRWFIAGSTHEGEEAAVLHAFTEGRSVNGSLKLLLAPRHPERFAAVEELCRQNGWDVARKTAILHESGKKLPDVILLDTMGELPSAYAAADIAFVGGSLVPKGGHNILEPALYGVPTIVGPHMENFREIADIFSFAGAIRQVGGPFELSSLIARWAADPSVEIETGRKAKELLSAFRGATERNVAVVEHALDLRRRRKD